MTTQKPLDVQKMQYISGWLAILIASILSLVILITSIASALNTQEVVAATEPVVTNAETANVEAKKQEPVVETKSEPVVTAPSWHYYNLDLQDNGTSQDDFNFGPPPQVTDADNLDVELRKRMKEDPVLGAAVMAWADAMLGTRYLGVFFDECDEEWDAAINKAKESWVFDKEAYDGTLEAFFKHLDKATKEVREEKGLTDQMYMNPDTIDGVPDVIVLETDNHDGKFLVYTFTIKGEKIELKYRLDCGFQPTNVAEKMKIAPKRKVVRTGGKIAFIAGGGIKPSQPISGGGGNPGGKDPTPKPKPKPKPTPKPKKDPTKGTPVLPNDDPGPGPNTNNPADPYHSTKDLPTNSNHMTPSDYQKAIEDLKDANEGSREGGDPNTPSTPTPPDTPVDDNSESGTGNGGIDQPTPVEDSSVSDDPPADPWDGPPD